MIFGILGKSLHHRLPPRWSLEILSGPWKLPGSSWIPPKWNKTRNKFIKEKWKPRKSWNSQRRAPKNNRDLPGQNPLNFHGGPFADKSDASWILMMHHEYSWCIMSTHDASWVHFRGVHDAQVPCLPSNNTFWELIPGSRQFRQFRWSCPSTPPRGTSLLRTLGIRMTWVQNKLPQINHWLETN